MLGKSVFIKECSAMSIGENGTNGYAFNHRIGKVVSQCTIDGYVKVEVYFGHGRTDIIEIHKSNLEGIKVPSHIIH